MCFPAGVPFANISDSGSLGSRKFGEFLEVDFAYENSEQGLRNFDFVEFRKNRDRGVLVKHKIELISRDPGKIQYLKSESC